MKRGKKIYTPNYCDAGEANAPHSLFPNGFIIVFNMHYRVPSNKRCSPLTTLFQLKHTPLDGSYTHL